VVAAAEIAETVAIAGTAGSRSFIVSPVFAPLLLTKIVLRLGFAFRPVASPQTLSLVLAPNPSFGLSDAYGFIHRPV
jgi:hypothetical protein